MTRFEDDPPPPVELLDRPTRTGRGGLLYALEFERLTVGHHPAVAAVLADDRVRANQRHVRRKTSLRSVQ